MGEDHFFFRFGYIAMAAFSGAVTALAFRKWRDLTKWEITVTLLAGFSFAVFVTPWVASAWFGINDHNLRAVAALTYIFGSGSNILLPVFIKWVARSAGLGDTEQ